MSMLDIIWSHFLKNPYLLEMHSELLINEMISYASK